MKTANDLETMLGDPVKAILSMFVPFLLAAAVVQINSFTDTFWVSGLGNVFGSAVATVSPFYSLIMCAGLGIGVGATTTIAFRLGRNEKEEASLLANQALVLGVVSAAIGSVVVFLLFDPIIDVMGAGSVRNEAFGYLLPYLCLSPVLLLETILAAVLRSEGAAGKSTAMQISAALFNMIIDPVLIYGLGMGVTGAGLATCVSAAVSLAIGLNWYRKGETAVKLKKHALRPDKKAMRELLEVGGPKTGQSLVSDITDIVQRVFLIAAGGTNAVMYYNYAWRYIGLVQLPANSLDNAMIPVCSAANGRNDSEKMRRGFSFVLKISLLVSLVSAAVFLLFSGPLVSVLTIEPSMRELRPVFSWTLAVSALLLPFSAMMGIGGSMLQALKRSRISMNYYLLWGFAKLAMYAVACLYSYEAIIYCMVAVHAFGGISLMYLAKKEFGKRYPGMSLLF